MNNTFHNISIRFCGIRGNDIDTGNQYLLDPKSDDYGELRKLHVVLPHTASPEIFYSAKRLDDEIGDRFDKKLREKYGDNSWDYIFQTRDEVQINNHLYYIDVAFQDESNRMITKSHIPVMM